MEARVATELVLVQHEQNKKAGNDLQVMVRVRLRGTRKQMRQHDNPPPRHTQDKTDRRQNEKTQKNKELPHWFKFFLQSEWSLFLPHPPLSVHNFIFLFSQPNFLPHPNVIYVCSYWFSYFPFFLCVLVLRGFFRTLFFFFTRNCALRLKK